MSIPEVLEHLHTLHEVHVELLAVAKQKRQILIDNQVDELSKIVAQETRLAKQVAAHEKAWLDAVHRFVANKGFRATPSFTMSDMIKMVPNAEEKRQLQDAQGQLQNVLNELSEVHKLNQELIQHSLDFIQYSLNLMTSAPEDDVTYGRPENSGPGASGGHRGFFDTRA